MGTYGDILVKRAKNIFLFFLAPFIGLFYLMILPFVGLYLLLNIGVEAALKKASKVKLLTTVELDA